VRYAGKGSILQLTKTSQNATTYTPRSNAITKPAYSDHKFNAKTQSFQRQLHQVKSYMMRENSYILEKICNIHSWAMSFNKIAA
jgi:hypothetical protein